MTNVVKTTKLVSKSSLVVLIFFNQKLQKTINS